MLPIDTTGGILVNGFVISINEFQQFIQRGKGRMMDLLEYFIHMMDLLEDYIHGSPSESSSFWSREKQSKNSSIIVTKFLLV